MKEADGSFTMVKLDGSLGCTQLMYETCCEIPAFQKFYVGFINNSNMHRR